MSPEEFAAEQAELEAKIAAAKAQELCLRKAVEEVR